MTITYQHLSGSWEHFDKTIAYQLEQNWASANTNSETPKFYSATGTNVSHSWSRTFGTNEIHCNLEEDQFVETVNGDTMHKMKGLVYVDIFARDANLLKLCIREVNRILWDVLKPNSSTRVNKSDGSASAIDHFDQNEITFVKERKMEPNTDIQPHASGTLRIIYYKFRS